MTIIIFTGMIGSGKTLSMVAYARHYQSRGMRIISNFPLNFPHTMITHDEFKKWALEKKQFNNTFMLLDEGYLLFDSRRSMSNLVATHMILQSRKRGMHVGITAQGFHQCDRRVRDNCGVIITCEFYKNYQGSGRDVVMNTKWVRNKAFFFEVQKQYVFDATKIYPLYDTNTLVLPDA